MPTIYVIRRLAPVDPSAQEMEWFTEFSEARKRSKRIAKDGRGVVTLRRVTYPGPVGSKHLVKMLNAFMLGGSDYYVFGAHPILEKWYMRDGVLTRINLRKKKDARKRNPSKKPTKKALGAHLRKALKNAGYTPRSNPILVEWFTDRDEFEEQMHLGGDPAEWSKAQKYLGAGKVADLYVYEGRDSDGEVEELIENVTVELPARTGGPAYVQNLGRWVSL